MLYNAAIGPSDGTVSFYRQRGFDSANPNIGNSIGASTFQTHASVNPNTPISVPQFGEAAKLPFPSTSTCCGNRLRPGRQGHGHKATATLPRPRLDHQYGALYGDVARAFKDVWR